MDDASCLVILFLRAYNNSWFSSLDLEYILHLRLRGLRSTPSQVMDRNPVLAKMNYYILIITVGFNHLMRWKKYLQKKNHSVEVDT